VKNIPGGLRAVELWNPERSICCTVMILVVYKCARERYEPQTSFLMYSPLLVVGVDSSAKARKCSGTLRSDFENSQIDDNAAGPLPPTQTVVTGRDRIERIRSPSHIFPLVPVSPANFTSLATHSYASRCYFPYCCPRVPSSHSERSIAIY